ncbi:MAG: response regulator [Acidimicrobiales bacterium]
MLHIEDDDATRRLVQQALERRTDITLVTASRGKLGLELARVHRPTVVLLHMDLPDIDGDVVLECLRNDPRTRSASVIVVGGVATHEHIQRLLATDSLAYIAKPFDEHELVDAIDNVLPAHGARLGPNPYGALVVVPQAAMTPSSVLSDMLHGALAATTRAFEHAHGVLELVMPL